MIPLLRHAKRCWVAGVIYPLRVSKIYRVKGWSVRMNDDAGFDLTRTNDMSGDLIGLAIIGDCAGAYYCTENPLGC